MRLPAQGMQVILYSLFLIEVKYLLAPLWSGS
jgi:hypothetical protein